MKFVEFLSEIRVHGNGLDHYDTAESRQYTYQSITEGGSYELLKTINEYQIVKKQSGNDLTIAVLDTEIEMMCFISKLEKHLDGYSQIEIWKDRELKFDAADLIFEYILPKVKTLYSDYLQTIHGQRLWKKLLNRALKEKYEVGAVIDKKEVNITKDNYADIYDEVYSVKKSIFYIRNR